MKCGNCGKKFEELTYLSEYGMTRTRRKDKKGYCDTCFDDKFPQLSKGNIDEEINEET